MTSLVGEVGRAVVDDVGHRSERRAVAVVAGFEEFDEIVLRPLADSGAQVAAQVERGPGVEQRAGKKGLTALVSASSCKAKPRGVWQAPQCARPCTR